jgi:hypothetical protein
MDNTLNTQNTVSLKVNILLENISQTCNALLSALEVNAQAVGNYGGGIVQHFDSAFVDRIVKTLLKLKYHVLRLKKELKNGLISSPEELTAIVGGLQQTVDELDTLMLEDGFMRNNFSFVIEELKGSINQILEEVEIR